LLVFGPFVPRVKPADRFLNRTVYVVGEREVVETEAAVTDGDKRPLMDGEVDAGPSAVLHEELAIEFSSYPIKHLRLEDK
jgi:hypothetical protein